MGLFTIDDARLQTITGALGVLLTALLSWLNRSSVYSQQSVDNIKRAVRITSTYRNRTGLQ